MRDFKDKVAVVTGGASGVGRCICQRLGALGAKVVVADIDQTSIDTVVAEFTKEGYSAVGMQVDVTREESVMALADKVFAEFGAVHLLFNNAGVGVKEAKRRIWDLPSRDWEWAFAVNVTGVTHGIRAFVPRMLEGGYEGHVINTSSGNGGIAPLPTTPIYASSKAALTSLTEVLHFQFLMDDAKLKAHVLYPGPHLVNTNILNSDRVRPAEFKGESQAPNAYVDMKALAQSAGVEFKLTEPEEVADMALDGIREDRFWILSTEGKSDDQLRTRSEAIHARRNPALPA